MLVVGDKDRYVGIGEVHGDPHSHGACANNGCALDSARGHSFRQAGDFVCLSLGKEYMAHRLGFVRVHHFLEDLTLAREPRTERQERRRFHTIDAGVGRAAATGPARDGDALFLE